MLRVFRHFLPIPTLVLGVSESVLLTLILYVVGRSVGIMAQGIELGDVQFSFGVALVAIVAMTAVGLYNSDVFVDYRLALLRMLLALGMLAPIAFAATYLFETGFGAREQFDLHWLLKATLAWLLCLTLTRTVFVRVLRIEALKRRILVLGTGVRALRVKRLSEDRTHDRFVPVAFVKPCGDSLLVDTGARELRDLEDRTSLVRMAAELSAKEIVIAPDDRRGLPFHQLVECKLSGIRVIDYVAFCERETGRVDLDAIQPSWFLSDGFQMGPGSEFVKRTFDLLISSFFLIAFLPVMVIAAIAIKIESPGPLLFRQERVGWRGRTFTLLKFRSMCVDAERDGRPQWAQRRDRRVTWVGAFIRLVRIDELPQLWNVLRGDMSFIGPRPERPYFVERLAESIPFYNERHAVRPGITGWAQVNYSYGASIEDARQKLSYDLYYLKNRDLFLDFVILIQTVRVILWPEGVR